MTALISAKRRWRFATPASRRSRSNHVLLTHIHGDHIGGLFEGEAARYPNAQVHVPRGDLAFYVDEPSGAEPPARSATASPM